MEKLLSVIVPVYNTEQYLVRCIESILRQKYRKLEIILVDDGSVDESGAICDLYTKKDTRISVYHNENQGPVVARNYGVSVARGDLVTFVDSDDWIEEDMYVELMGRYEKYEADIVSSGYIYDNGKKAGGENDILDCEFYDRKTILQKVVPCMMYDPKYGRRAVTPSLCTKLFKKSLFLEAMRNMDIQITYGDDAAITYIAIAKADKIVFVKKAWYHYCGHDNSLSRNYDINSLNKIKQFENYMEAGFRNLGIWEQTWYPLKQYVKLFLGPAVEKIYGIEINAPAYIFPFDLIKKDTRIVIYGAGIVGKSYYRSFYENYYGKIEGWIDKNCQDLSKFGYYISRPEKVIDMQFDYIVIAIEDENVVSSVKRYLKDMGVPEEKMVWEKPRKVRWKEEVI